MQKYLTDASFLKEIDLLKTKEQYVRITILTFAEKPIADIEGNVTAGSINIDGSSSMRRTCNITFVPTQDQIIDYKDINNLLSINKKVKVEIGITNTTKKYPTEPVIWFPQGIYVICGMSISKSTNGFSISLQLKDKMCLLNGECGGVIPASTQFDEYSTIDANGKYVVQKPTIYQIIQEVVNHFGGEQLGKIIISDVPSRIKKVMKWIGDTPLYLYQEADEQGSLAYTATINYEDTIGNTLYDENKPFYEYNDNVCYIYTDFVYTDELIANAGDSVCTILDSIKEYLGNFEYFYDINGNFIFQEVKNYLNVSQSSDELDKLQLDLEDYQIDLSNGKSVYSFDDAQLITSFSNTPRYDMIKNDFVVWGIKKNAEGLKLPIRYHLAIDEKPPVGTTFKVIFGTDPDDGIEKAKVPLPYIADMPGIEGEIYYDSSSDIFYEWAQDIDTQKWKYIQRDDIDFQDIVSQDWRTELYLAGAMGEPYGVDSNYYYAELKNEWPKLYDIKSATWRDDTSQYPSDLDFYLDFIDTTAPISEFSISNIGRRTKVLVDDKINCLFEPDIPDLIFIEKDTSTTAELREEAINNGQAYSQIPESIKTQLGGGGGFNSAYDAIRSLLYQYTSYNESITIQALPVYYLEPNTRISIYDKESGISGDYVIQSISLPLDINGTMSISCIKALERV